MISYWPDDGDGNSYTVSELKEAINTKKEEIRGLELDLRKADLDVAQAERKLSDGAVKATLNGIVKSVGDPDTGTSNGDPFITVTSDSGMYVKGTISELMLSEIQVGSTITGTAGECPIPDLLRRLRRFLNTRQIIPTIITLAVTAIPMYLIIRSWLILMMQKV